MKYYMYFIVLSLIILILFIVIVRLLFKNIASDFLKYNLIRII